MEKEELFDILKYGEHLNLECKEGKNKLPNSIWSTYSAFANSDSGMIVIGIKENLKEKDFEKRFTIEGVENSEKQISDFWNTINSEKVNKNILVDDDVSIVEIDDKKVILINVPQADFRSRPIFINGNPYKGTYKRNYEGDYHATKDEIKAMIRDQSFQGDDGTLLDHFTLDDLDLESIESYRNEFASLNQNHIWNKLINEEFLKKMGAYQIDRKTGNYFLTKASLLMFGKSEAIMEAFGNVRFDYIDQSQNSSAFRWQDKSTFDITWENNLYNFSHEVTNRLYSGLKRPFKLEGAHRIDDSSVHKALREAVINLIIHSDFNISGVLKVIKDDRGYHFFNPGRLKIPIDQIYQGGSSVARNPRIQNMFRMIGFGENIGSGFPLILETWEDNNWRFPDLKYNSDLDQVELNLFTYPLQSEDSEEFLTDLFGDLYNNLSKLEKNILRTALFENNVTTERINLLYGNNGSEIEIAIQNLLDNEFLIQNPNPRWYSYKLNSKFSSKKTNISPVLTGTIDNKKEKIINDYVLENGSITISKTMELLNLKSRQSAASYLNKLVEKKILKKKKNGKENRYVLVE